MLRYRLSEAKTWLIVLYLVCLIGFGLVSISAGEEAAPKKGNDTGVVGGLVHFVGEVIAFPFRVVGHTIDAIF